MAALIDTIARPYAKAIFEVAVEQKQTTRWAQQLNSAAAWVVEPQIAQLLNDPKVMPEALYQLFNDLFVGTLDEFGQQFIQLLIEYKRLMALPQIAREFNQLVAAYEKRVEVKVATAFALTSSQTEQLLQALRQRLQCEVELNCAQDETLIGGAVIRVGDTVIDGSLRGRLNRLRSDLEESRL
ncbi:MAG: F0F1 ATP synthase subunit delta [Gammaproteobacteria bacterium]|nr:F0F1 ATP synthase subunit delta [Gammaproteobacteria bacterium]